MLTCRSCMRKAFTTLVNHTLRLENTFATLRPGSALAQSRRPNLKKYAPVPHSASIATHDTAWDDSPDTERLTLDDLFQDDSKVPKEDTQKTRRLTPAEWAARKHLQFAKDPVDIAKQVQRCLHKDDFETAAIITRKAGRDAKVVVSWNYLLDYQLKKNRLHAALKLYNEMKKRGQLPNAQTYTIIFRGCATSSHPKLAVSEALKIYNIMLRGERIKPNTIHMNAVLHVCARSQDIDALFSVVQTANEGIRAPNCQTYTTIFNALRISVGKPLATSGIITQKDIDQDKRNKQQVIQRARAVWEEVISKWRAGSIIIDEELVCAMGRILLLGSYHDIKSIEALLEQTMMIPREGGIAISGPSQTPDSLGVTNTDPEQPAIIKDYEKMAPGTPTPSHALPGNNSLSLIITAVRETGKTTLAQHYWQIFTKRHNVVPDADNWYRLFTTFRRGRNSTKAVLFLRDMPAALTVAKVFRAAMGACLRDNLNPHSFSNATAVLDIMLEKSRVPDMQTLRIYLRVAYSNKRHFVDSGSNGGIIAWAKQVAQSLDQLWRPYMMVSREYASNGPESDKKRELVALARKMIAASDRIITAQILTPEKQKELEPRRNSLNRLVTRHFEQMAEIDPNFKKTDISEEEDDEE
ncbi:uncharacterized protein F4807DRAFT_412965 [Annulohypoxylon truncatum]|uniref:uncharacterized protein n=1 Tax=Annulohypoxylon truncatum TaxID=327061 RepID=UPI002008E667|nr:uncharacterized protein F4807DRAFT_412965 [Annulohypoxylon truncatum]KAI1213111.1 hypothetical protein F4807DRAFT_412965 [Annulohypoxylon truncatum]